MKPRSDHLLQTFLHDHPMLADLEKTLLQTTDLWIQCFLNGGKLLLCGNGGSAADADHITGELMKGFLLKRTLTADMKKKFTTLENENVRPLMENLQYGLPAISLNAHAALISAVGNDTGWPYVFAQQVMGYGKKEDILIGISTSGNAENVYMAALTARALEIPCIALTGENPGRLGELADCCIAVPAGKTFRAQEYHIAVYHLLCALVESEMYED